MHSLSSRTLKTDILLIVRPSLACASILIISERDSDVVLVPSSYSFFKSFGYSNCDTLSSTLGVAGWHYPEQYQQFLQR